MDRNQITKIIQDGFRQLDFLGKYLCAEWCADRILAELDQPKVPSPPSLREMFGEIIDGDCTINALLDKVHRYLESRKGKMKVKIEAHPAGRNTESVTIHLSQYDIDAVLTQLQKEITGEEK